MATQSSQLITNLTNIYNTKILLKEAIGTQSDIFADYPSYVTALKPSGSISITENVQNLDIAAYAYATVAVEGGEIPAGYTYVSGTSYITTNGEHNVSSYAYAYVTVEGGGGGDPYNDATWIDEVIHDELFEENIEYLSIYLSDNYEATLTSEEGESTEYTIEFDSITNMDGNDVIVHVIANAEYNPLETIEENYSSHMQDVYDENITVILEYAMVTESEDPSNDGYDYLAEGTFKYFGLETWNDNVIPITENGFYVSPAPQAFSVDVTPSTGEGTFYIIHTEADTFPDTPTIESYPVLDLLDYEDLQFVTLSRVNYVDPYTDTQTQNPYWSFYFSYNGSELTNNMNTDGLIDSLDNYWNKILLGSGTPDMIIGKYMEWVSDIDPETGDDNGSFEVSETLVADITETLEDGGNIYDIKYDEADSGDWLIILDGNVIEQVTPEDAKTIVRVYSQGTNSQTDFVDQGDGTWLEAMVVDGFVPGRVLYEVYRDGTNQPYQVSSWDSTSEVLQFEPGTNRDYTVYGSTWWNWLWDTEDKTLSHAGDWNS